MAARLSICLLAALGFNQSAVVTPLSPNYNSSLSIYNLNIPILPAAVTYPSTTKQVAGIVRCAAEGHYKVQAKGGGHSYGNYGWGGESGEVVINLANLNGYSYDNSTGYATVGAGSRLGPVTTALYNSGERAFAHGSCPDVGIGGHATIGGVGPTSRRWGATIDHVVSATVVLADGSIVTVSETENPDLFWALRGAGGSFFVVTEFVLRTEAAPAGGVSYAYAFRGLNATAQAQVFRDFQAFISNSSLSRDLYIMMIGLPSVIEVTGSFFGSLEDFNALGLEQAFAIAPVANVTVIPNWLDMVGIWATQSASAERPAYFYAKSLDVLPDALLSNDTIDSMFKYLTTTPDDALIYELEVQLVSGAMADVASSATSFPHRDVLYWIFAYAATNGTVSNTTIDFLDGINDVIYSASPNQTFHAYAGYVDPLLSNGPELYWADNLPRLEQIKKQYDQFDVFHNPQSVPVGGDSCGL
ncbi:hypothetical protein TMatcc_002479 [Talaromyces marneffei ATCC 18224]|uniref:FAD-binding PCMH-type domain-containing protein n=2 Tax=Talaromyces marneffei TaxID=37727 RepID=B6QKB2_TALMQ|nr:uncharacterized protein EYB26_006378 [Talaromyces marneffei]EEA23606.1 conserved hypothetical protein [Talaromyces marneffei ATCC 18224]KAE8552434.1 hypothetical protein EYB25_006328 [Talaromyces marneffei]QGA18693.1 hypothetical protein EYB26_006378 [Talaromyces marneffei]